MSDDDTTKINLREQLGKLRDSSSAVQAESCSICGKKFSATSFSDLNQLLYHHGVDRHMGDLRRAARRSDQTTDPVWVADYISGRST